MMSSIVELHKRSSIQIVPLRDEHLPKAAELFATGYQVLRRRVPSLPERHENHELILPKLKELATHAVGVVAIRKGKIVGFMIGRILSSFRNGRTAYSPEWAHAAVHRGRRDIYHAMYTHISRQWVDSGCLGHLITILADQKNVLARFFETEFGMMAGDAMRDVSPIRREFPSCEVRRAGIRDTDTVMNLREILETHMANAPVFFCDGGVPDRKEIEKRLCDPKRPSWLAYDGKQPVGYIYIQPGNSSAAYIISDPQTASIKAAVTVPHVRSRGVGALLLDHAIRWAQSEGFVRCSVDFEPQNQSGCRFWLRHFQPVAYSLLRQIDPRIVETKERGDI